MEINLLLLLLNAAGAIWVLGTWLGKNEWSWPILQRSWRWLVHLCPGRRVFDRMEKRLDHLANTLALLRLRQEAIENHTATATVITDAKGSLIWASFPFLDLVQLPLSEIRGSNWINCIHQDDRSGVMRAWKAAVETQSNFAMDYRYWRHRSQKEQWVSAMAKAAFNPFTGNVAGWTATVIPLRQPPEWARPPGHHKDCPAGHWVPPLDRSDFGG